MWERVVKVLVVGCELVAGSEKIEDADVDGNGKCGVYLDDLICPLQTLWLEL